MSVTRLSVSVAANATIGDILESAAVRLQQRTAQRTGQVTLAFTQSAAGLDLDIILGARVETTGSEPVVKSIAPIVPDDLFGTYAIGQGEQVSLPVRNTTGGALTLGILVDTP